MEIQMNRLLSGMIGMTAVFALAGCNLEVGLTYDNDYAGDWYEMEEKINDTDWDAVKLALSDTTFEISTSTFDADGDNPDGYKGESKGSVKNLSTTQIYMSTTEIYAGGSWKTKNEYIEYLVEEAGLTQLVAEVQANAKFIDETVSYVMGLDPSRLKLGDGAGTGSEYSSMTYYTSIFAALSQ
jgi:hypothetical protein